MIDSLPAPAGSAHSAGFYVGDSPAAARSPTIVRGKRSDVPLVINALELKKLTQKLEGNQVEERLQQMLSQDREERYRQSKARVKNWDNTFAGQRRMRIAARAERLEEEEAARVEQDKLFRADEISRREAAIQRAKKLQYTETDMVKAFHSRVMLLQVLEVTAYARDTHAVVCLTLFAVFQERDMQMQLKKARKDADSIENEKYHKETVARVEAGLKASAKAEKEAKIKRIQLAKDQLQQQKDNTIRAQHERKVIALEESQRLALADREYHQKQRELEKRRRENAALFNKQLQELRAQIKERDERERQEEKESEASIEAWVNRKAHQTQLKKDLETKWYNDSLNVRQQIGENQFKISSDADAKIEEQIKQRMLERDAKALRDEQERLERKKKNHEELRKFFQDYLQQVKERKQRQKEEDQRTLAEYMRIRDEANAQKEALRAAKLSAGKSLQDFHLKQIERNSEQRSKDKSQRLADAAARREQSQSEDQALLDYMKHTAEEPWAIKNRRLQTFIQSELGRAKPQSRPSTASRRAAQLSNTTNRLGFTNDGYSKMDMMRTCDLVGGDALVMIGEGLRPAALPIHLRPLPPTAPALVASMPDAGQGDDGAGGAGAGCILFVPSTERDSAVYAALTAHLRTTLAHQHTRRWLVSCRLFIQQRQQSAAAGGAGTPLPPRVLYMLSAEHHQPRVHSLVVLADRSRFAETAVVEGGRELGSILAKLKNMWTPRQTAVIEGGEFVRGGVAVRVGLASVGSSPRGILVHLQPMDRSSQQRDTSALDVLAADLQRCIAGTQPSPAPIEIELDAAEYASGSRAGPAAAEALLVVKSLRSQSVL
ncbi:hypothetical protein HK105_201265 [Polyrhizophydium stewartii]|uniref:Trichohyalin-plectin-homology domain-containing protein n=1 Tax=Polyrhizophydium stewartii TaxID=2732419 RepID=A0ABR4NHI7_9FUNG